MRLCTGVCELATANWLSALPHPSVPGNGRNSRVVEKLRTGYRLVCVPVQIHSLVLFMHCSVD